MGFVNEYISKSDMDIFKIKEIDKNVNIHRRINSDSWTIDRDRGMYLRCVARGGEEFADESSWTFFWEGELIWVELKLVECGGQRNAPGWSIKRITKVCLMDANSNYLPAQLTAHKESIIRDLYEALLAYKDRGVYSLNTAYKLTLEVAEGVWS